MAQRKIIFLIDSCESLLELSNFVFKTVLSPQDLGIVLFHKELFNFNFQKLFNSNDQINIEHTFIEILGKIIKNSVLSLTEQNNLTVKLKAYNIQPHLYFEEDKFLKNLYSESLFADILVCNTSTIEKLIHYKNNASHYISECLHCPLLVVPNTTSSIKNIFLVFDGEPASMRAIKDFNYILPHLYNNKDVTILSATPNKTDGKHTDKLLMQYAKLHIPNIAYMKIEGSELDNVLDFAKKSTDTIVVVGANFTLMGKNSDTKNKRNWETQPIFISKS